MIPKRVKQRMSKLLWDWLEKLRLKKSREKTPRDSDRFRHDRDDTRYRMAPHEKTGWSPKSPEMSKESTPPEPNIPGSQKAPPKKRAYTEPVHSGLTWDGTRYRMAPREKTGWSPKSPRTSKESTPPRVPPTPSPVYSESRAHHGLPVPSHAKPKTPEPTRPNPGISERYVPPAPSLSIPSEADLLYPTVCALRDLGGSGHKTEIDRRVIETEGLSKKLIALRGPNGISKMQYRLGWVRTALKGIGVVVNTSEGYWSLTEKGLIIDEVKIRSDHADYRRRITQKSKIPEPTRPNLGVYERYDQPVSSLPISSEADLLYPTVCALRDLGGSGRKSELVRKVTETEGYSSNKEPIALKRRLGWVLTALKGIGVVVNTSRGYWSLTKKGLTIDEVEIRSDHADYRKRITQRP